MRNLEADRNKPGGKQVEMEGEGMERNRQEHTENDPDRQMGSETEPGRQTK